MLQFGLDSFHWIIKIPQTYCPCCGIFRNPTPSVAFSHCLKKQAQMADGEFPVWRNFPKLGLGNNIHICFRNIPGRLRKFTYELPWGDQLASAMMRFTNFSSYPSFNIIIFNKINKYYKIIPHQA